MTDELARAEALTGNTVGAENYYQTLFQVDVLGRRHKSPLSPPQAGLNADPSFEHHEDRMPTHSMSPRARRRRRRLLRAGAGNERRLASGGTDTQVALESEAKGMRRTIRPVRINCTAERSPLDNSARRLRNFHRTDVREDIRSHVVRHVMR
jgi:hypothetical protein